ncbi:MAG: hypothetical protein MUP30_03355 [Deltaproteobacteria bacterium]|nr:hypothetical protein [Deltaproteobacteria bacterium]
MLKSIFVSIAYCVCLLLLIGFATPGDSSGAGFNPPAGFILYKSTPKNSEWGRAVAIQPDGKLVVLGVSYNGKKHQILVLRFNSDGTRDNTFGVGGVFIYGEKSKGNNYGSGVALQPDGKIIVVGDSYYDKSREVLVLRCNSDGSLDNSFGKGGVATYRSQTKENKDLSFGVKLQSDARIVVVGSTHNGKNYEPMILRYNRDGSLDSSFGKGGVVTYKGLSDANVWGRAVAIQHDGRIVMVGVSYTTKKCDVVTVRYNADGSLDKGFGEGGVAPSTCPPGGRDWGRSIAMQPDGKIIVAGNTRLGVNTNILLLRYNANGKPDTTFGRGGIASYQSLVKKGNWGQSVALLPDGKILIVGNSLSGPKKEAYIARCNSDGTMDSSFGKEGLVLANCPPDNNNWGFAVTTQPDGKIIVVGYAQSGKNRDILVARYKKDGTLDAL